MLISGTSGGAAPTYTIYTRGGGQLPKTLMQVSILLVTIPPGLTPGALIFSVKIPTPGTAFQCKNPAPGSKKRNKIPTPGHNFPGSNAKISMKKEHNSLKQFLSKFSIIVHLTIFFYRENKVFASLYTTLTTDTV